MCESRGHRGRELKTRDFGTPSRRLFAFNIGILKVRNYGSGNQGGGGDGGGEHVN